MTIRRSYQNAARLHDVTVYRQLRWIVATTLQHLRQLDRPSLGYMESYEKRDGQSRGQTLQEVLERFEPSCRSANHNDVMACHHFTESILRSHWHPASRRVRLRYRVHGVF